MLLIIKRTLATKTDNELAVMWNQINCWDWPGCLPKLPKVWSSKLYKRDKNGKHNTNCPTIKIAKITSDWIVEKLGSHYLISKDWHINHCNKTEAEFEAWWNSNDNPWKG